MFIRCLKISNFPSCTLKEIISLLLCAGYTLFLILFSLKIYPNSTTLLIIFIEPYLIANSIALSPYIFL